MTLRYIYSTWFRPTVWSTKSVSSLFIHYSTWAFCLGSLYFSIGFFMLFCFFINDFVAMLSIHCILSFPLLMISLWKCRWFLSEPGHKNPYKTVYDIIHFAKSHKHPLRCSAFTHCDNYVSSRLDFAKKRFGGPFTTEQVKMLKLSEESCLFYLLLVLYLL